MRKVLRLVVALTLVAGISAAVRTAGAHSNHTITPASTNVQVTETNSGDFPLNTAIAIDPAAEAGETITLSVSCIDGTATKTGGTPDYVCPDHTETFTAGETGEMLDQIRINGDTTVEPNETFTVDFTAVNCTPPPAGNCSANLPSDITVTIVDDDTPKLSINDVSQAEGNAGTSAFTFTVTMTPANPSQTVTVNYSTAPGTATAGTDYQTTSGTVSFAPNVTTAPVNVLVNGDTNAESSETFFVNLSSATNATIADGQGRGLIVNDDGAAANSFTIDDVSDEEGNSGTKAFTFTVTLGQTPAAGTSATVQFATSNGTATAGSDYTSSSGTLTFDSGETVETITVSVMGDTTDESDETFTVTLSNPACTGVGCATPTIADGSGTGTILDDDGPAGNSFTIDDVSATEGNSGTKTFTFTVTLGQTPAAGTTATVEFTTSNGTATAGSDYTSVTGTRTFDAGETTETIAVSVLGDTVGEPDETFSVTLSNPGCTGSGCATPTIADGSGTGTILDDDGGVPSGPTLRIESTTVREGGRRVFRDCVFTVTLSPAATGVVKVDYATEDRRARSTKPGIDYIAESGTLTFEPGDPSEQIAVSVKGDRRREGKESFIVNLSNATGGATIGRSRARCLITEGARG